MRRRNVMVGLGILGLLAACGSSGGGGGSNVDGIAGASGSGSAGAAGGLMLGTSGGGAAGGGGASGGGVAGTSGSGSAGGSSGGSAGSSGGGASGSSAGDGGSAGRPPSAANPVGWTIYFCIGDGCPHGGPCSGGDVPSCDQQWGALTPETVLCEPAKAGNYCLWTDKGQWLIDCADGAAHVRECSSLCGASGGVAHCN